MENHFHRIMVAKSDADLQKIFQEKDRYEPEAYLAAVEELERRHLITAEEKTAALQVPAASTESKADEARPANKTSWRDTLQLFKITDEYAYTPIIIAANVLVWLLMVLGGVNALEPSVQSLIDWGGNLSSITLNGQPWRLLTSTFLHGGVIHLLLNMYALIQVGHILEIHFGKHRYALTYLVTGIFASISSAAFSGNVVSVGASGAIFGLYGLLVSLLITKSLKITTEERKALLTSTLTFVGYNVAFGFAKSGIDNAAHIGGLLSGFIIGFIYYPFINTQKNSVVVSALLAAVMFIAVWLSPQLISNSYIEYESVITTFSEREQAAMWMYEVDFPPPGSDEATHFRERLKTEGVDLWNKNIELLNTLRDMPFELRQRIDLLKTYCQLRAESCELMQTLTEGEQEELVNKLSEVNDEIDKVIDTLTKLNE